MCQRSEQNQRQAIENSRLYEYTYWEFVRKCGSASREDNCSREAPSHVGQYSISNGHNAEHVGFELTDYPLDAEEEKKKEVSW